jgi:DNA-binding CsgD family transcriptional regulator
MSIALHISCQNANLRRRCRTTRGAAMVKSSIARLTARHRDCLQLVVLNHSTKEIALLLKLSPNTVDGYISEAKDILGASSRRDAARIFRENARQRAPQGFRGNFSRVDFEQDSPSFPLSVSEEGLRSATKSESGPQSFYTRIMPDHDSFHWFRGAREHNSLKPHQRLLWIAIASLVAAIIFLVALNIIDTLARLFAI